MNFMKEMLLVLLKPIPIILVKCTVVVHVKKLQITPDYIFTFSIQRFVLQELIQLLGDFSYACDCSNCLLASSALERVSYLERSVPVGVTEFVWGDLLSEYITLFPFFNSGCSINTSFRIDFSIFTNF